jgi:hypothetical protein
VIQESKKEGLENLSKGEYFGRKITHRMEAPFVPLALQLPNPIRKTQTRFTPET